MAGEPVRLDLGGRVFHRLRGKTTVTGAHPFGNPDLCSRREREITRGSMVIHVSPSILTFGLLRVSRSAGFSLSFRWRW